MSEHRPADEPGGDDSGFVADDEEHPLEGGQGDEVDEAQQRDRERDADRGGDEGEAGAAPPPDSPGALPNPTH